MLHTKHIYRSSCAMHFSFNIFKPRNVRADSPAPSTSATNAPTARRCMFLRKVTSVRPMGLTDTPQQQQQQQQQVLSSTRPDSLPPRLRTATPAEKAIFSFIPASFANQRTTDIKGQPVRTTVIHYIAIEEPGTRGKEEQIYAVVPCILLFPNEKDRDFLDEHGILRRREVYKSMSIKCLVAVPSAWESRNRPRQSTSRCVWECIVTMHQTLIKIGKTQAEVKRIYVKHFINEKEAIVDSHGHSRPSSSCSTKGPAA